MKKKMILLVCCILVSSAAMAQYNDPVRMAAYTNWDIQNRKVMETQASAVSTMAFHHSWIKGKEDDITDLKNEFRTYLENLHEVITTAAEIYGTYYELSLMANNLRKLSAACEESPANVLANAFNEKKRNVVEGIVFSTTDLLADIRKAIADHSLMSEAERNEVLESSRNKIRDINRQLRRLERNIRYYNLCDLWNEIRNKAYAFRKKTNGEIAREAQSRWTDHYRIRITD